MKITAQEEYGLRCALQLARGRESDSLTIPEIAEREGLSSAYVAKLLNLLRQGGLVKSARGRSGGYTLGRASGEIRILDVLGALGSPAWEPNACSRYPGSLDMCIRSTGCAIRSLWGTIDSMVNQLLGSITLSDLLDGELQTAMRFQLQGEEITQPLAGILERRGTGHSGGRKAVGADGPDVVGADVAVAPPAEATPESGTEEGAKGGRKRRPRAAHELEAEAGLVEQDFQPTGRAGRQQAERD